MTVEDRVRVILNALSEVRSCEQCGTRVRFGDLDCPHCGMDLDDELREWALDLLGKLGMARE